MKYSELRKSFVRFFEKSQHRAVPSSSLIPFNDPTLLFTNAGMNQFKDVFLGREQRDYQRAVTVQKCLRAGGKHNDLENVGFTTRHHTFFEMLGNFSFGDYFKKEAIRLAWEFLTVELQIPKDRLYVTVFETDDEAAEIWHQQEGVPKERIFRFGEKDNFWRMGQTGPCGPCSEIFYDHHPEKPPVPLDEDEDRYVEIWNLVFMQFFEDEEGAQTPLPKPSVDTGAGIERIAAAMQGFSDNYQSDVFQPLMKVAAQRAGLKGDWDSWADLGDTLSALKVVADHARSVTFLLSEGVLPSNEGRGYVLRRIMRRAIRFCQKLNETTSVFPAVCAEVIHTMSSNYPELMEQKKKILNAVQDEEKRFLQTLSSGSELLNQKISELQKKNEKILSGEMAFTLYDTYGFPVDLTRLIAREKGLILDEEGFESHMENARAKAKAAAKSHTLSAADKQIGEWTQNLLNEKGATQFVGYDQLHSESPIIGLFSDKSPSDLLKEAGWAVFSQTPFYAEGGGQIGDQGTFTTPSATGKILNCIKINDIFLHRVELDSGTLQVGDTTQLATDRFSRAETANNHSATHLLHAALRQVLGNHVKQAGSLVTPGKLRFDFSHGAPVSEKELQSIESLVNQQIAFDLPTRSQELPYDEAVAAGALAMFGEKYGDQVRMISLGEFSTELCGGTHVSSTSQIRLFKIFAETGVSAGVRRIEAVTGRAAFIYLNGLAEENKTLRRKLHVNLPNNILEGLDNKLTDRVEGLMENQAELERKIQNLQAQSVSIDELLAEAEEISIKGQPGYSLMTQVPIAERKILSDIVDRLRDKRKNIVIVLAGEGEPNKPLVVAVSKTLNDVHAGKLTKELCTLMGGKGGGRADFSQGSIGSTKQWKVAKEKLHELIQ